MWFIQHHFCLATLVNHHLFTLLIDEPDDNLQNDPVDVMLLSVVKVAWE